MRKVAIFASRKKYAFDVVRHIESIYNNPFIVILERPGYVEQVKNVLKAGRFNLTSKWNEFIRFSISHLGLSIGKPWQNNKSYKQTHSILVFVQKFNSKTCADLLKNHGVEIVLLAGSGIIREIILDIPNMVILNAHPGILPYYRGMGVVEWAIIKGDKLGVSVHEVQREIDAGSIYEITEFTPDPGDSLLSVKNKMYGLAAERLVTVSVLLLQKQNIPKIQNDPSKGRTYFSKEMTAQIKLAAQGKLDNLV